MTATIFQCSGCFVDHEPESCPADALTDLLCCIRKIAADFIIAVSRRRDTGKPREDADNQSKFEK